MKDHHNGQFVNVADICALDVPTREYRFEVSWYLFRNRTAFCLLRPICQGPFAKTGHRGKCVSLEPGVENIRICTEKLSTRHASILKQFAIALELFNKKSLEYRLLNWLCELLQAAH
jgi:hypothetical protein